MYDAMRRDKILVLHQTKQENIRTKESIVGIHFWHMERPLRCREKDFYTVCFDIEHDIRRTCPYLFVLTAVYTDGVKKIPQILIYQQLHPNTNHTEDKLPLCAACQTYNYISGLPIMIQILDKLIINSICTIQWPQKWHEPEFCFVKDLYLTCFNAMCH